MNKTTKVATVTAGIIAMAWMFAKRVSKNSVNGKPTIYVIDHSLEILGFPENMSSRNQQLFKVMLDDFRKAYAEEKAQGKSVILVDPFGKDVTRLFQEALKKNISES